MKSHRSLLGTLSPGSECLIRFVLAGLRSRFVAPDYEFDVAFNPKTGDHDVHVSANHPFPPVWLDVLRGELEAK